MLLRKLLSFLTVILLGITVYADIDNQILIFSTPGIDRYADGTVVRDGEFYAVVCAPNAKHSEFYGFTSSGTLVDPENNYIVCRLAKARNGRCPRTTLSVPNGMLTNQVHIVLMDTRLPETDLPGANNIVRGYSVAVSASASELVISGKTGVTAVGAELPRDIPKPVITGFEVYDGYAVLSVSNTVPGVYYSVSHAGTVTGFHAWRPVIDEYSRAGCKDGEIILSVPVEAGDAGFFRIEVPSLDGDAK